MTNDTNSSQPVAVAREEAKRPIPIDTLCNDRGPIYATYRPWQLNAYMDSLESKLKAKTERVKELAAALELMVASAHPNEPNHPTMFKAWNVARAALANKPE